MPRNLVPLSELPSQATYDPYDIDKPTVTWDVELPPHVDLDRLQMNMTHMRRVQKLGYFSVNHFTSYHGDTTQYEPTVVGVNSDGSARAGIKASVVKRAPMSKDSVESPVENRLAMDYFKGEGRHELNRSEMSRLATNRLGRSSSKNANLAWAKTLDDAAQDSITAAARTHLMGRTRPALRYTDTGIYTITLGQAVIDHHSPDAFFLSAMSLVALRVGAGALLDSVSNKAKYGDTFIKERRWSSFFTMQPEAYVALHSLASVSSLIRYQP